MNSWNPKDPQSQHLQTRKYKDPGIPQRKFPSISKFTSTNNMAASMPRIPLTSHSSAQASDHLGRLDGRLSRVKTPCSHSGDVLDLRCHVHAPQDSMASKCCGASQENQELEPHVLQRRPSRSPRCWQQNVWVPLTLLPPRAMGLGGGALGR